MTIYCCLRHVLLLEQKCVFIVVWKILDSYFSFEVFKKSLCVDCVICVMRMLRHVLLVLVHMWPTCVVAMHDNWRHSCMCLFVIASDVTWDGDGMRELWCLANLRVSCWFSVVWEKCVFLVAWVKKCDNAAWEKSLCIVAWWFNQWQYIVACDMYCLLSKNVYL